MDLNSYANERKNLIKEFINEYIERRKSVLSNSINSLEIFESLREYIFRGKMLRGILFLFTCEMFGQKISQDLLKIASAIEITHSSLLIHDDIIDRDQIRRGKMSFDAFYSARGKKIKADDPAHYGRSIAIVAADIGFFMSIGLIADTKNEQKIELLQYFSDEILNVGFAEALDSDFGQTGREAEEIDIIEVYRLKTARYTFSLPFVMACIAANSNKENQKILNDLGENAGIIFQIKDDELGLFGTEAEIGKPVGSDIRENKKTLIRWLLFKHANNEEKAELNKKFGNPKFNEEDMVYVLSMAKKYDIKTKSDLYIKKYMVNAWDNFEKLSVDFKYKNMLKTFLEFNIKRTY